MMEKIEWYQEVLKLDPDSKVFFPLAKLLRDSQQPDKAIEVLRAGLRHSSVFLEARLLLIQILFEQSRSGECSEELSAVTGLLENYPAFWEVWAESVSEKNRDLALAIRLMASTIRHPERSLSLILESGLGILQDVRRSFSSSQPREASDSDPACGVSPGETLCMVAPSAQEPSSSSSSFRTAPVEEPSLADAELLESMLEESAPVREQPPRATPFLPNKAKPDHMVHDEDSGHMADENPEEPTLRTR
uniref:tetratricopeptide repeat protein n=1 Tax=uncultured Bilophila sp. TaxID=529385 RepID=UPI002670BE96